MQKRRVVFVCRTAAGESLRAAHALTHLDDVELFSIVESEVANDTFQVTNVHDAEQLIAAARKLIEKHGPLDHIVTAQETLLEPVAKTREALGIPGMSSATVRQTLDKSLLKSTLRRAGIQTPPDRIVTSMSDAVRFLSEVGFPIMLKPLSGSGALATLLIHTAADLDHALQLMQPSPGHPVLAEAYLPGQELCLDTITIDNEPQLHSICCYYPSILEALEHPEQQWSCLLPREMDDDLYGDFIEQGLAAIRALSVRNSFTHMEGFLDSQGRLLGFTDATLRPAGARIGPMLGFAYDIDPYRAWARVAVDGCFDGPWERKYAVGTIFLRGTGSGEVEGVDGIETVKRELGDIIVDARWPKAGARKSDTYTGDGYITLRHPDTSNVKTALELIRNSVKLTYSEREANLEWKDRFQNYKELNRPAWEVGGSQ
jgi:biotin carboxylase